jgi:O-antigen biosynthesis protein WbqP
MTAFGRQLENIAITTSLRAFDIFLSIVGLLLVLPVMVLILVLSMVETGRPIFLQERVGRNKDPFILLKFRTMAPNTPSLATHLASSYAITPLGRFLRRVKLDELPQLWNVLKGEMSLVGPRPGLPNQPELTVAREKLGVFEVRPGITGLAQINGIDMSTPELLAQTDARMIAEMSVRNYFKYIFLTVLGKGSGDRVKS